MLNNLKPVLSTDLFHDQIRLVAPRYARVLFKKNHLTEKQIDDFYTSSGLKLIFRHIFNDGIIRDKVEGIFCEYSTLVSTIPENSLDAFIFSWGRQNANSFNLSNNVASHFENIIKALRTNKHALFGHPQFMINTTKVNTSITFSVNGRIENVEEEVDRASLSHMKKYENLSKSSSSLSDFFFTYQDELKSERINLSAKGLVGSDFSYEYLTSNKLLNQYLKSEKDPLVLHSLNHHIYDKYFNSNRSDVRTVFVSIPLLGSKALYNEESVEHETYEGIGVLFFYFILRNPYNFTDDSLEYFYNQIKQRCTELPSLVKDFLAGYTLYSNNKQLEKLKQQSVKSAISKVMARNTSHNVGSHVLSRMTSPENISIDRIVSDEGLFYTSIQEKVRGDYKAKFIKENSKEAFYNKLMSCFLSYLKTRTDFLADIVSGTPQVQSSKWFVQDVMEGLDDNRLLLNRISGIDKFHYRFNFTGLISGHPEVCDNPDDFCDVQMAISADVIGQHAFYTILENIIRNTAKHSTISAHEEDGRGDEKEVDFTINVRESTSDPSLYCVSIDDGLALEGYHYLKISTTKRPADITERPWEEEKKEYFEPEGEDAEAYLARCGREAEYQGTADDYDYYRISRIDRLVIQQNLWLNKPILNPHTFDLRQRALGLIEMKVCAAYLRRIPVENVDEDVDYKIEFSPEKIKKNREKIRAGAMPLNLMRAVKKPVKGSKTQGVLGYQFYVPKPKKLLILDQEGSFWEQAKAERRFSELECCGVLLLNAREDYQNDEWKRWRYNPNEVYPHQLMLHVGELPKIENERFLPFRQIAYDEVKESFGKFLPKYKKQQSEGRIDKDKHISIDDLFNKNNEFITEVWRAYTHHKFVKKGVKLPKRNFFSKLLNEFESGNQYDLSFEDHGDRYSDWSGEWEQRGGYHEIYNHQFKDAVKERIDNQEYDELDLKFQYLDAALTNVLVIDERIQEQANKQSHPLTKGVSIPISEFWNYTNVYIPSEDELALSKRVFSAGYLDKIKSIIEVQFGECSHRQCKGLDFLIIHLGVVEKILTRTSGKSKENATDVKGFLNAISEGTQAQVILTSGRAPGNLSAEFPFLSYSVISHYLIEYRFKTYFNEVLNASRPKISSNSWKEM